VIDASNAGRWKEGPCSLMRSCGGVWIWDLVGWWSSGGYGGYVLYRFYSALLFSRDVGFYVADGRTENRRRMCFRWTIVGFTVFKSTVHVCLPARNWTYRARGKRSYPSLPVTNENPTTLTPKHTPSFPCVLGFLAALTQHSEATNQTSTSVVLRRRHSPHLDELRLTTGCLVNY